MSSLKSIVNSYMEKVFGLKEHAIDALEMKGGEEALS